MTTPRRKRAYRVPSSLSDAHQMCLDHAMKRHNRSIKRIADLMGVKIDTLTEEQVKYLGSWEEGT